MRKGQRCHLAEGDIIIVRSMLKGSPWEVTESKGYSGNRILGKKFRVVQASRHYSEAGQVYVELEPLETFFYVDVVNVQLTSFKKLSGGNHV